MGLDRRNVDFKPIIISREEVMKAEEVKEVKIKEVKKEEPQIVQEATGEQVPEPPKVVEDITREEIIEIEEDIIETPPEPIEYSDDAVICLNTREIYVDNKEASEKTGINASSIKKCCNGNAKSAGKDEEGNKLVWKYVKDLEEMDLM